MKSLMKIRIWGADHPKFVSFLRIALGLILIWKGISFILNLDTLDLFLKSTDLDDKLGLSASINFLAQLIIIINLLGGFCITLNLHTRLFCWFNLPVLFGAVFLVNMQQGVFAPHSDFWLSSFAFLAIVFTLIVSEDVAVIEHTHQKTTIYESNN